MPTRKWITAQVVAIGAWLVAAINAGWHIHEALQITAVGIVVQAISTWLVPNQGTPGGVPAKRSKDGRFA